MEQGRRAARSWTRRPRSPAWRASCPHYGKYSYLAFEGDEPTNMVKGQWSTERIAAGGRSAGEPAAAQLPALAAGETPCAGRIAAGLLRPQPGESRPVAVGARTRRTRIGQRRTAANRPSTSPSKWPTSDCSRAATTEPGSRTFTVAQGPDGQAGRHRECRRYPARQTRGVEPTSRSFWAHITIIWVMAGPMCGTRFAVKCTRRRRQCQRSGGDAGTGPQSGGGTGGSRNLVFVAFSAEECGRLGSQHYVAHPDSRWPTFAAW